MCLCPDPTAGAQQSQAAHVLTHTDVCRRQDRHTVTANNSKQRDGGCLAPEGQPVPPGEKGLYL